MSRHILTQLQHHFCGEIIHIVKVMSSTWLTIRSSIAKLQTVEGNVAEGKKKQLLKQNKPRLRGAGLGSRLYSCFPLSFLLGFPVFLKFCWTLSLVPFATGNLWFSFFFLNGSWRESERDMWSWRATAASVMFDWKAKSTGLIFIITGNILYE